MESYGKAAIDIQRQIEGLSKSIKDLGSAIGTEIDHPSSVSINRGRLEALRNTATRVEDLEDQNGTLTRRNSAQEAQLKDKIAENETLAQDNERLRQELQKHRDVAAKLAGLEKENQLLKTQLEQSIRGIRESSKGNERRREPRNELVSTKSSEDNETAPARDYDSLAKKYNRVKEHLTKVDENLKISQEALMTCRKRFEEEKEKNREWGVHDNRKSKQELELKERLESLRQEIMLLRARAGTSLITIPVESPTNAPNITVPISPQIEIPSSPRQHIHSGRSIPGDQTAVTAVDMTSDPTLGEVGDAASDSPMLLGEDGNHCVSVEDTQFLPIESCNIGSTQDDNELPSLPQEAEHTDMRTEHALNTLSSVEVPVVTEVRKVRKRKTLSERSNSDARTAVKIELLSSSPLLVAALRGLDPAESLDLDEIGEKQTTPRKGRYTPSTRDSGKPIKFGSNSAPKKLSGLRTSGRENDSPQRYSTPSNANTPSRSAHPLQNLSTNSSLRVQAVSERPAKRQRIISDLAIDDLAEDSENFTLMEQRTAKSKGQESTGILSDLLDAPAPLRKTIMGSFVSKNNPKDARQVYRSKSPTSPRLEIPSGSAASRPSSSGTGRDSAYGSRPSSRRSPAIETPNQTTSRAQPKRNMIESRLSSRDSPQQARAIKEISNVEIDHPDDGLLKTRSAKPKRTTLAKRQSRAAEEIFNAEIDHPDNEPLRCRPIETLTSEDFVVNKGHNGGYKYAFKDVVRGKQERRCLQGCTKPECCGKQLLALAQLEYDDRTLPYTELQEEEDAELLKEYLGGNAHKLRDMKPEDRKALLIQAKVRELANKFGGHRHAYERPKSPPGFWRIDFPTTQEAMEDQRESKKMEQAKVRYRYMEAMRPDGAYKFRDE